MRVAFYAPMKPPDHPRPSGDRLMARNLIDAISDAGHSVFIASRFRSRDGHGDPARQSRLQRIGRWHAERLIRELAPNPPNVWLTYHLYYKAADWIGPMIASALGIPYVVAEASHAPKRAHGSWALSHDAVARALRQAALVICPNPVDRACVAPLLRQDADMMSLPPFIARPKELPAADRLSLARRYGLDPERPWILTVAMMRPGDKMSSYEIAASALSRLDPGRFQHIVLGDGAARESVEGILSGAGSILVGQCEGAERDAFYAAADMFFWPGVNEAWGMVFLEAQSFGLPVVGGRSGGVEHVIVEGETGFLCALTEPAEMAAALDRLIEDAGLLKRMGMAAKGYVQREHSFLAASESLGKALERVAA